MTDQPDPEAQYQAIADHLSDVRGGIDRMVEKYEALHAENQRLQSELESEEYDRAYWRRWCKHYQGQARELAEALRVIVAPHKKVMGRPRSNAIEVLARYDATQKGSKSDG